MGSEMNSPSGKRNRDPEDEIFLDNFHSHKRYLSEVMASSLNGLSVGDSLPDNLMEFSSKSESIFYHRDEICSQYSPMSEDSYDSRYCDPILNTTVSQPDSPNAPTSPVSPHKHQKLPGGIPCTGLCNPNTSHSCNHLSTISSQSRHRGSDSEARFPSSPSDIYHPADLRRAALLRSVQMRAHPLGLTAFEFSHDAIQNIEETEDRLCSFSKSSTTESEYQSNETASDFLVEDCPIGLSVRTQAQKTL